MTFEKILSGLSEWHFYKEFTYTKNIFIGQDKQEYEAADCILYLKDMLFIFQIKERIKHADSNSEKLEAKWFKKKVLGEATKQIRDSNKFFNENKMRLDNGQNDPIDFQMNVIKSLHNIILYSADENLLPNKYRSLKFHYSNTTGIYIHILSAKNYYNLVKTLKTITELSQYFNFRENIIKRTSPEILREINECALIGQYLSKYHINLPDNKFIKYFDSIIHLEDEWSIDIIIRNFKDWITSRSTGTDYYKFIEEIAAMTRDERLLFKDAYRLAINGAKSQICNKFYGFAIPRLDCGFVFIPFSIIEEKNRDKALNSATSLLKYNFELTKCIGIILMHDPIKSEILTTWLHISYPWEEDVKLDECLKLELPPLYIATNASGSIEYIFSDID